MWSRKKLYEVKLFDLSCKYRALKEVEYCRTYDYLFQPIRFKVTAVLELGINNGGSLKMWRDYFPNAKILGVDINPCDVLKGEDRISTLQASQADVAKIAEFLANNGIQKLDIVIDDAAHIGNLAKASFWPLFDNHLREGGYYIVEDWGTGYWPEWPDGKSFEMPDTAKEELEGIFTSHSAGMVGFVKQLVDEAHRYAIKDAPDRRPSKFQSLLIKEAMAIAQKAEAVGAEP